MKSRENKSMEGFHKRLNYILDKVEWNQEDMEWMLAYLESGDDKLMKMMMDAIEKIQIKINGVHYYKKEYEWKMILDYVSKP